MKAFSFPALSGALMAAAVLASSPASADVFSSQTFTGDTSTLRNLPGVNLDAAPGFGTGAENCVEDEAPAFSTRDRLSSGTATTCKFGNFSITTTGSSTLGKSMDTTYGGNPPPWMQGWRP